jgi:inorganic pyrophosphatase
MTQSGYDECDRYSEMDRRWETMATDPLHLPPFDSDDAETLNVIIDTPKGSRNKFEWDKKHGLYKLGGVLAAGAFFPYDFGFVPSTLADDGDAIDVLVLMEEPAFVGCLVPSRLIGGFGAFQTEEGKTDRNDRLLAVAANSRNQRDVRTLDDLNQNLIHEIEHFFVSYNVAKGKKFEPQGRFGPEQARQLVIEAAERFREC